MKYFELKKKNLQDAAKAELRGNCITIDIYIRREERSQNLKPTFLT